MRPRQLRSFVKPFPHYPGDPMKSAKPLTLDFSEIRITDTSRVGGKNASLGELFNVFHRKGIGVLDGFATTADAFRLFLQELNLEERLKALFENLDVDDVKKLSAVGFEARRLVGERRLPPALCDAVLDAYDRLCQRVGGPVELAVRSSATAEDLPEASFAGAAESYLNIGNKADLISALHKCFASLYTDRAISYRAKMGYGQLQVAVSVGVMAKARSDKGISGMLFSLVAESGFRAALVINGSWVLGDCLVKESVTPDERTVFKSPVDRGVFPMSRRKLGTKI